MDTADEIRIRIKGSRNTKGMRTCKRLADFLVLDTVQITGMANADRGKGTRAIEADELAETAEFSGEVPPGFNCGSDSDQGKRKLIDLFEMASTEI